MLAVVITQSFYAHESALDPLRQVVSGGLVKTAYVFVYVWVWVTRPALSWLLVVTVLPWPQSGQ